MSAKEINCLVSDGKTSLFVAQNQEYVDRILPFFDQTPRLKYIIVIDTRNNGGGDLVADLAMFLSGKKFFDYTTDTRSSGYEPNFRWTKPSISLANEANYSDGHCYAYTYQSLGLGKLVGMPVPGTCTFAGWEALQDANIRWGVPPLGVKANLRRLPALLDIVFQPMKVGHGAAHIHWIDQDVHLGTRCYDLFPDRKGKRLDKYIKYRSYVLPCKGVRGYIDTDNYINAHFPQEICRKGI
jgi:hypothetical protein